MGMCLQTEIPGGVRAAWLRRIVKEECGAELFEAALVLPVLLLLLIGIVWIGRAISVYQALELAARDGARAALSSTCATCGSFTTATAIANANGAINGDLSAASLDPLNPGLVITVNPNQPLDPSDPAVYQLTGVTVTVIYPVQLVIPFTSLNGTTVNISSTVSMRQEF